MPPPSVQRIAATCVARLRLARMRHARCSSLSSSLLSVSTSLSASSFPRSPSCTLGARSLSSSSPPPPPSTAQPNNSATSITYGHLLHTLYTINRDRHVRMGLENTHLLLSRLSPELYAPRSFETVHVAGTNGKGSVCTKIAAVFTQHGVRTGLYTSPHLSSFRERMRVDNTMISEDEVCTLLPPILRVAEQHDIPVTFFELTTVLALVFFHVRRVPVAVIEVGLGGRIDSTNVISPLLSVITSISLEHTQLLGSTVEAIATEKAGIVKPHTPVLSGPSVPVEVVARIAAERHAPHFHLYEQFASFEEENEALARLAVFLLEQQPRARTLLLEAAPTSSSSSSHERGQEQQQQQQQQQQRRQPIHAQVLARALESRPPCRFEVLHPVVRVPRGGHDGTSHVDVACPVVLDVGHNPQALERMTELLARRFPEHRVRVILGMSKDKDAAPCLRMLMERAVGLHIAQAASPRAASQRDILQVIESNDLARAFPSCIIDTRHDGDPHATTLHALQLAARTHTHAHAHCGSPATTNKAATASPEVVLICGTFFIFRAIRRTLGLDDPVDPFDLNESSLKNTAAPTAAAPAAAAPAASSTSGTSAR